MTLRSTSVWERECISKFPSREIDLIDLHFRGPIILVTIQIEEWIAAWFKIPVGGCWCLILEPLIIQKKLGTKLAFHKNWTHCYFAELVVDGIYKYRWWKNMLTDSKILLLDLYYFRWKKMLTLNNWTISTEDTFYETEDTLWELETPDSLTICKRAGAFMDIFRSILVVSAIFRSILP